MSLHSPNASLVLNNPQGERRVVEVNLITPLVKLGRFFRVLLILLLILAVYGVGVFTGTSGMFSDSIAEIRRIANIDEANSGVIARAIFTIEQLDAAEGIDKVKTRHGVARSINNLDAICSQEITAAETNIQAAFRSNFRRSQAEFWEGIGTIEDRLINVEAMIDATAQLSANAELDCGRTHQKLAEVLGFMPVNIKANEASENK